MCMTAAGRPPHPADRVAPPLFSSDASSWGWRGAGAFAARPSDLLKLPLPVPAILAVASDGGLPSSPLFKRPRPRSCRTVALLLSLLAGANRYCMMREGLREATTSITLLGMEFLSLLCSYNLFTQCLSCERGCLKV
jgi:hypothetical protein